MSNNEKCYVNISQMKKKHLILLILFLLADFNKIQGKTYTLHRSDKTSAKKLKVLSLQLK